MVNCKCCGQSISQNAQTCPHCGEPSPVPPPPPPPLTLKDVLRSAGIDRKTFFTGIIVFFGVGMAAMAYQSLTVRAANQAAEREAVERQAQQDQEFVERILRYHEAETRRTRPNGY